MKILAWTVSNSHTSINGQLIAHAARLIEEGLLGDATVEVLDVNDFEMPFYRPDRDEAGIPAEAHQFFEAIGAADALVISFAEHNGHYPAIYKNLFDWMSRIETQVYQGKPAVFFSSSPGSKGGGSVMKAALDSSQWFGSDVKASLSVPKFYENFDSDKGEFRNAEMGAEFRTALSSLAVN